MIPEKNEHYLAKDYPTIGTVLSEAGIANGAIGKWHIGESQNLAQSHPDMLKTMREVLDASYERFDAAKRLSPNPDFDPGSR